MKDETPEITEYLKNPRAYIKKVADQVRQVAAQPTPEINALEKYWSKQNALKKTRTKRKR